MKASLLPFVQPILLWLVCWGTNSSVASSDPLVEWLRAKPNGFFSNKIAWKQLDSSDPNSAYAMFASEDISKDEGLIVVPQSALITSKGTGASCDTVKMLLEEVENGKDSKYLPYIDYLFGDDTRRGRVPSAWSEDGQELLRMVIGDGLFPTSIDHHSIQNACPDITDNPSQLEEDAYLFMISRSWGDVMIPGKLGATTVQCFCRLVFPSCSNRRMLTVVFIVFWFLSSPASNRILYCSLRHDEPPQWKMAQRRSYLGTRGRRH